MSKRVLIACEFSGIVRDAFLELGHDAWSCDIQPARKDGSRHIQTDVLNILDYGWDLMIAHPPCTYLSYAGNRWLKRPDRWANSVKGLIFFKRLMEANIPQIAIENPRGWSWHYIRKPDQIIHPYQFGHEETKATCLWLKNLPPLMATYIHPKPFVNWTKYKKGSHSGQARSVTFTGIAEAMAQQWGGFKPPHTVNMFDMAVTHE